MKKSTITNTRFAAILKAVRMYGNAVGECVGCKTKTVDEVMCAFENVINELNKCKLV